MIRSFGVLLVCGLLAACSESAATRDSVARTAQSQMGAIGFWTEIPERNCIGSFNTLQNITTGQEVTFHVAPSAVDGRAQQSIVFKELSPGSYALVEFTCNLENLTSSVKYSERSLAAQPDQRLVFEVRAGETSDYGVIRVQTGNSLGANAIVRVAGAGTTAVSRPSSERRMQAIKGALGPAAADVVVRSATRGGT